MDVFIAGSVLAVFVGGAAADFTPLTTPFVSVVY